MDDALLQGDSLTTIRRRHTERWALIALFAGAVAIGFSPIFVRLSELGPSATAFWRVTFAVPVLTLWLVGENRRRTVAPPPRRTRDWALLGLSGFFFAGDLAFWHWSIKATTVANATLLANFAPLFVTPVAYFMFGERFKPAFIGGMLLSIAGAALLMGQSLTVSPEHIVGDVYSLITAMFYSGYVLVVTRLRTVFSTATIMTWTAILSALLLYPLATASGESLIAVTAFGWAILIALALFSHAGGQSLIAYALAHLPASFSSVGLLVQPAVASFLAWSVLGENLGGLQAAGGAVVLAGIVIARRASQE
jgi:drug/metabolite transporter (DMT)-like permease